jgi:hypothetical protein
MEQGPPQRPEAPAETERRLDNSGSASAEQLKRDLALFNLAIDSKLRGRDLVRLRVNDLCISGQVRDRRPAT